MPNNELQANGQLCARVSAVFCIIMSEIRARINGPRPPFYILAEEIWPGEDFDSYGDSQTPESESWTELTIINSKNTSQRIHVDPESRNLLVLAVRSEVQELAQRAAQFIVKNCSGEMLGHA
ncbi:hypothetical protein ACL7TT_15415 [Microbulbifer sp. 2304DJ12-6]|uniref:hypothetical protein n=1 Tax=Microbulbifer sp. 2304DJ12-6 TaxID=3233340 RepID=UPI0039AF0661